MNILVSQDYSCKLTDFGCAKLVADTQYLNTYNSGTPLWMAPEVKRGIYSFSADVYSLGLVLYELFENRLPLYDTKRNAVQIPTNFHSASVILPCLDGNPPNRPTVNEVVVVLDVLIQSIVRAVQSLLPEDEQMMILSENGNSTSLEDEIQIMYRHLLSKHPIEVDGLIQAAVSSTSSSKSSSRKNGSSTPQPSRNNISQPTQNINQTPNLSNFQNQPKQPSDEVSEYLNNLHNAELKKILSKNNIDHFNLFTKNDLISKIKQTLGNNMSLIRL
jgi:hypothetical protein